MATTMCVTTIITLIWYQKTQTEASLGWARYNNNPQVPNPIHPLQIWKKTPMELTSSMENHSTFDTISNPTLKITITSTTTLDLTIIITNTLTAYHQYNETTTMSTVYSITMIIISRSRKHNKPMYLKTWL